MAWITSSKSLLRKTLNLFLALSALYSFFLSAFLLLRNRLTENYKAIGWFNSFAQILMLPTLILMPINLLFRPWSAWPQVIPVAHLIASYGRTFMPRKSVTRGSESHTIKVLTFNLHGEYGEPVLDILRSSCADIIALQEVSGSAADCFKSALQDQYPYQALYTAQRKSHGQGILSRYPITSQKYWRNPHIAREALAHLRVEIDFSGTSITVYNTHPLHPGIADDGFDTRPRGKEVNIILEQAAKDIGAVLIMGDLNMTDQSEDYRRISAQFNDSFHQVGSGMGFTFPDLSNFQAFPSYWPLPIRLFPFLRLDYIFHSSAFRSVNARVWPSAGGSDHRPMWAELALIDKNGE